MPDNKKEVDDEESEFPYELTIIIKKGTVRGGGLANSAHVVTSIDGIEIHKTSDAASPPQWNQTIVKRMQEVQRTDPIVLGFSVYKKRWTSSGYKLVGSTQFQLSELLPSLNKDPVEKEIQLNTNRLNLTLSGTLSLSLQLKELIVKKGEDEEDILNEEPFTWSGHFEKWKTIVTTSKKPVNAIAVNLIHDMGSFFKFSLKFENPYLESLMKLISVACIAFIILFLVLENRKISQSVNSIDRTYDMLTERLTAALKKL
jgi:hypothetical protein